MKCQYDRPCCRCRGNGRGPCRTTSRRWVGIERCASQGRVTAVSLFFFGIIYFSLVCQNGV